MADIQNIANIGVRFSIDYGNTATNTAPLKTAGTAIATVEKQMSTARYAGMNFNRVIQDSPFFFQNFNMGIMSVANNIAPLAESFAMAKQQGAGLGMVLKGMFTGMGGWLTVLNLVVAGVQAVTFWFAKQEREAKNSTKETSKAMKQTIEEISEYKKALDAMATGVTVEGVKFDYAGLQKAVIETNAKIKDITDKITFSQSEQAKKRRDEISAEITALSKQESSAERMNKARLLLAESNTLNTEQLKAQKLQEGEILVTLIKKGAQIGWNFRAQKAYLDLGGQLDSQIKMQTQSEKGLNEEIQKRLDAKKSELDFNIRLAEAMGKSDLYLLGLKRANLATEIAERKKYGQDTLELERELQINRILLAKEEAREKAKYFLPTNTSLQLEKPNDPTSSIQKPSAVASAFTTAFTSTFTTGMNQAWEQIFGKANSIGEMFIQSFVSSLVSNMASGLADVISGSSSGGGGGFLGFVGDVIGGIGSLFGLGSANTGGGLIGASGNVGMQTVNINVDGKTFMKAVYEPNFKKSANNMIRTRQL